MGLLRDKRKRERGDKVHEAGQWFEEAKGMGRADAAWL